MYNSTLYYMPHAYKHVFSIIYSTQYMMLFIVHSALSQISPRQHAYPVPQITSLITMPRETSNPLGRDPSSRSGPMDCGGSYLMNFIRHLVLFSGPSHLKSPTPCNIRHLDGLMTNQPMLTHNCGVIHLVFLIFGGMLGLSNGRLRPRLGA